MSRKIGTEKENLALAYLLKQGLKLVARNFACKSGEIDLIMQDKATLVFVEVRFRNSEKFGSPVESVSWHKQQRLIKTAQYYLLSHSQNLPCRFDVLAIRPHNTQSVIWIKNAFGVSL